VPEFLHIAFGFHGKPKVDELEPVFNKALDWMRYTNDCWLVWTTSTPQQWYQRLKPHLAEEDSCLITTIDLSRGKRSGQLSNWQWQWIKKDRQKSTPE
jgi:hypothetical protein